MKAEYAKKVREEMMIALSEVARKNGMVFDEVRVYGLKRGTKVPKKELQVEACR
jgi:hypothetical protein